MIKIVQFGEGNFLRAFAEHYFEALNSEGKEYSVDIVTPIPGNLTNFKKQNNRYNVVIRGIENGQSVERAQKINVINSITDPFVDREKFFELSRDSELKIIVSNTTEAGITYNENDKFDGFENITFPAKLTKFLYERFKAGQDGVYLMPVELIDNNADELYACVDKYIKLWNLPSEFKAWNDTKNFYCNTLVDRIVSGYPRDTETEKHLHALIGEEDKLLTIGEPFGLWAVEKKGEIAKYIPEGRHNIDVVLTEDINYYKKRKVRILNGCHTSIVAMGLLLGKVTVDECMTDEKISSFMETLLENEIIPFVSDDIAANKEFAQSVKGRFLNPYLNHQLTSIALNSVSKFKARCHVSFKDYYKAHGTLAPCFTLALSYLMALYSGVKKDGDKFVRNVGNRTIEVMDDREYLEFFANGGSVADFLCGGAFGEDLSVYNGLVKTVSENAQRINNGEIL